MRLSGRHYGAVLNENASSSSVTLSDPDRPHHRTYTAALSPFRRHLASPIVSILQLQHSEISIHTSPCLLSPESLRQIILLGQFPSSSIAPFPRSPVTRSRTLPFGRFPSSLHSPFSISTHSHPGSHPQPPFSIPDLHSLADCPLGSSLPAYILHSRSPFARASTSTFVRTQSHPSLDRSLPASILHSRSPFARIYFFFCSHSIPPFLGPFPSGFHFHSPISDLVPDDGARATTFAEAQRWQEV